MIFYICTYIITSVSFVEYGESFVDVCNLYTNCAGFGGSIDVAAILDFVDSGHDLIVVADSNASDLIREIATECGVDFDEVPAILICMAYM